MRYISRMFGYEDRSCITVAPRGNGTNMLKDWSQHRQVIHFDLDQASSKEALKHKLKLQAFCAVALLQSDSLGDLKSLMSVTRPIDSHVIVYLSQTIPTHNLIQNMNRPVVWALPLQVIAERQYNMFLNTCQ